MYTYSTIVLVYQRQCTYVLLYSTCDQCKYMELRVCVPLSSEGLCPSIPRVLCLSVTLGSVSLCHLRVCVPLSPIPLSISAACP